MAGSYRKRGNSYYLEFMYKGTRYYDTVPVSEVKKEKDIELILAQFVINVKKGNYADTNYTFYEFAQIWLKDVVTPNSSPITVKRYIGILNNRIFPYIGHYKLTDINVLILTSFFNELKQQKTIFKHRENKPLSKGSILKFYEIVNAILQKAYEFDLILSNPCKKVKLKLDNLESEINKKEDIHYYDRNTYNKVLELLQHEPFYKRLVIETALKTGLRRSELFGLTWEDIDFKNKTLSVNKTRQLINKEMTILTTKNKSSNRTISIPDSLVQLLSEAKKNNKEFTFIFEQVNIDSICTWFRKWQTEKGIQRIRFHDLRHTHATLLLLQGVDIKTISKRLGHSNIGTTMNTYTHVLEELDIKASQLIDEL